MNKLENRELDRMAEKVASLQEERKDVFNKLTDPSNNSGIEKPRIDQAKKNLVRMGKQLEDISESIEALKENK